MIKITYKSMIQEGYYYEVFHEWEKGIKFYPCNEEDIINYYQNLMILRAVNNE